MVIATKQNNASTTSLPRPTDNMECVTVIPPMPKAVPIQCGDSSIGYVWNKTAWIVNAQDKGRLKIVFEYRSPVPLSSIAWNNDFVAVGDSRGTLSIFQRDPDDYYNPQRPIISVQVLQTDLSAMVFLRHDVLFVGGGAAGAACRQFITAVQLSSSRQGTQGWEVKVICDGTGGPTAAVNEVSVAGGNIAAAASDDRSVTVFELAENGKGLQLTFKRAFSDYGGLVQRVALSGDGRLVGYGGTAGRCLVRDISNEEEKTPDTVQLEHPLHGITFSGDKLQSVPLQIPFTGPNGFIRKAVQKDGAIELYDHVGTLVFTLTHQSEKMGSLEPASDVYIAKPDRHRISLCEKDGGGPVKTGWSSHDSAITSMVWFKTNGNGEELMASVGLDGHLMVWRPGTMLKPVASTLHAHHGPIAGIASTSDGQLITFGQEDATIRFFRLN